MAHIDLKKDAHIFTQAGATIQNLLNLIQSFETNELEELRDLIAAIKDINTTDDDQSFKQQLLNVFDNAVMEDEVTTKLDNTSTLPPQTKVVKKAIDDVLDRIKQTNSDLSDEIYNRQTGDQDITTLVENESLSRQNTDDKINRELYGSTTNSYTLSSDIDPAQVDVTIQGGSGVLSVDIENLTNAFVLNGTKVVSEGKTIATYQIEYGENISRLFAVVDYNVQLKTFDFKLVNVDDITSSVDGNVATLVLGLIEFNYGFNTGQGYILNKVTKNFPYTYQNVSQNTVIKINGLADLQTIDKSSFMSAINELARTDMKVNVSLNDIKKELNGMSKGGIWHYGEVLTHTANLSTPVINNSVDANIGDFYLNSNTFSVYFCVGDDNGNHNWLYIGNLTGSFDYSNYASVDSPHFEGIPTAPTPSASNNSTQIATTEYVRNAIDKYAGDGSGSGIDFDEAVVDDLYYDKRDWTCTSNKTVFPAVKLKNADTGEIEISCFDFGTFEFRENLPTEIAIFSTNSSSTNGISKIVSPNKTTISYVPKSNEKMYINAEYDWIDNILTLSVGQEKINNVRWDDEINKRWEFTLGYYTITLAQDESTKQYSIQTQDSASFSSYGTYTTTAKYKMSVNNIPTTNHTNIISALTEVCNIVSDNAENNKSDTANIGTLIYALHPDITTIKINGNSVVQNSYYGELITTDVNEIFVLDNQFDDFYSDYNKYNQDQKGHFLYTNDEVGYRPTKDILENKKAFCRILSKPSTGADNMDGEIEVLLTF